MKKSVFLTGLLAAFSAVFPAKAEDVSLEQVVLRGLDKVTGRISTMTVNVGEKARFGALDIYVRVCFAHPPEETPENAAYLDIVENKTEGQLKLFSGWMFSSSPALSAMEHPVFDVWVLRCQGEQVTPPVPEPLVLENQIEAKPVQPKVKIILDESEEDIEKPVNPEEAEIPSDGVADTDAESDAPVLIPLPEPVEETSEPVEDVSAEPVGETSEPVEDVNAEPVEDVNAEPVEETSESFSTEETVSEPLD